ncbi:MAG: type II secretion system GspH family protein [Chitinispirillales bacterium]|jgi:hypothetical protein|nr:type II secretion system GspH family protein [Chitinispirillales bacterium]
MTIKKTNNKGITLVEVIVVALLMSILAIGAFSIFMMYMDSLRETTARLKLQRQSEAILDELAFRTRDATLVLRIEPATVSDIPPSPPVAAFPGNAAFPNPVVQVTGIEMRDNVDNNNNVLYSFRLRAVANSPFSIVEVDSAGGGNWTEFRIDENDIQVVTAGSFFEVSNNRKQVRATLTLGTEINNREYFLPVQGAVRCRN